MTLIEALVAVALVAVLGVAALGAAGTAVHAATGDPVRDALAQRAGVELGIALDVLKYQGATLTPRSIATSLPLPSGTSVPAHLSIAIASDATGTTVTVTAGATQSGERAIVSGKLAARAPLPGTLEIAPQLVAAPTGAP